MKARFIFFGLLAMSMFTLALSGGTGTAFAQIDDGYGLSLESFTVDTLAVPQYERFTVRAGIRNRREDAFPDGHIGAALVNESGDIAAIIGDANFGAFNPNQRYSKLTVNCIVPKTVTPGPYRLRIVIKPTGGEWKTATQAADGVPNSVGFEVTVNQNAVVAPLIETQWSQGAPYNNLFPLIPNHSNASPDNKRLVTDCGTTAFVQIMAFHRHPSRGAGQSAVVGPHNITVPPADLNAAYDWDNMLNAYTKATPGTERQQSAVATLMYHFGLARSAASGGLVALVTNFGYDKSIQWHYRSYYNDAAWEAIIRQQLDARLPVYFYGNYLGDAPSTTGYHASVIDGYDNKGRFHVNWGWGGKDDGWYSINNFDPKASANTYAGESIVINIKPNAGSAGGNEFALIAFDASRKSVPQNELFTATVNLRSVGFFSGGQAGLALADNNGKIVDVVGIAAYGERNPASAGERDISAFVPSAVSPGQYKLRIVTRLDGGKWKPVELSAVRNGIPSAIPITVTAGEANGGGYGMGLLGLTASKTTVSRYEKFDIGYQFKNIGMDAFDGEIGAALVDNKNNIAAVLGKWNIGKYTVGSRNSNPVSRICSVPHTVALGRYRLRMVVRPSGGGEWRIATVSVDNSPTGIDFTVR
jgi:hypothetical protein